MTLKYIIGQVQTKAEPIPKVSSDLRFEDKLGSFKVRWGINRDSYAVEPGLYALGSPTPDSHVLVTANYKLTFDIIRNSLKGRDVWILVLDTKGVNVWCAAGKGTFGTEELVNRIAITKLSEIVNHRKVIVPQLGATGIAAHEVLKRSGFSVVYGPVRAEDLIAFLGSNLKVTQEMRKVTFSLRERIVLIPVDFVQSMRYFFLLSVVFLLFSMFSRVGFSLSGILSVGLLSVLNLFSAFFAGIVFGPILLPILPGKSFAMKGLWRGLLMLSLFSYSDYNLINMIGWMILIPSISSYLLMNFTGASTYTSMSGVKKEMRIAIPLQLVGAVIGMVLLLISRFI